MDPLIQDFEFLDLTDINDAELEHLQKVLYATEPNPNVKYPELPWVEPVYDEMVSMNGDPNDSIPEDTQSLNADMPPYPPSSAPLPVTMYQMMPSVYVNNVTANVSVHPYMGYHALYQPQESQPQRGRRPKSSNKTRDYRNSDPNLDSPNAGGQVPQGYPPSFIPMQHHPYTHYYANPPPPSAQHATGTPLFLPSHVPIYPPPPMYPYHPPALYSPIEHSPYPETPVKENIINQYPPPEKLHTYEYNNQNRMKDNIPPVQYQTDTCNEVYPQDTSYNNQNNEINTNSVSKEPPEVVQYQPKEEVTNFTVQSDVIPSQNINIGVNNVSVISEAPFIKKVDDVIPAPLPTIIPDTPKAAINSYSNGQNIEASYDSTSIKSPPTLNRKVKSTENQNIKPEVKKVDPPEVKMEGAVKYVGGVIVSELKSDAQVFRPANKNISPQVFQSVKDKAPITNGIARSPVPVAQPKIEPVTLVVVKEKPAVIVSQQHTVNAVPEDTRPNQQAPNTSPVTQEEDAKSSSFPTPVNNTVGLPSSVPVQQGMPEPAPSVWGKPSFASLFQKCSGPSDRQDSSANRLVARVEPFQEARDSPAMAASAAADARRAQLQIQDPHLYRLGEFLNKYELEHKAVSLLPRGLTNRSNWCYINSILQSLLACPPFYNLMKGLPMPRKNQKSTTPILDSIVQFVNEFQPLSSVTRSRKERSYRKEDGSMDVQTGPSFEPAYIYKMLNNIRSDTFKVEGRQEDAEEFLSCLLNALNDEMMEVMKMVEDTSTEQVPISNGNDVPSQDDSDSEWKVMGPKNKGSITRRADFGRTPISDIFRGHLRSRVQRTGDQSTDNVQPFFTLQLDIEKSQSVREALELLVGRDQLEGVTCSKTNKEVEAWQQLTLEDLPMVLVLHLKWFDYKLDGCSKITKTVEFPIELKVDPKLMSSSSTKKYTPKQKQYKLFAVVYHDGKEATKGHYITDVFHVGYGGWVRYDDSTVRAVQETSVLHPRTPRVPYLLYYRRCDTIGNQTPVR